jgi:Tetratricopeptide repeat
MKGGELGESHPDVAVTMNNLVLLYVAWGKSDEARLYLQQAVQILKTSLGASHPTTRAVRANGKRIARGGPIAGPSEKKAAQQPRTE